MNILCVHQNFPGQYKHLAPALARQGHRVVAMPLTRRERGVWRGVELVPYSTTRGSTAGVHHWVADFETKIIRGEACFRAAQQLRDLGFSPDIILAHHGWGESLFLKEVWPRARMALYCEFYYNQTGGDVGFDPEFPPRDPAGDACRLRIKNLNNRLNFDVADAGISPTHWQASTFPEPFRGRITVVHDGIDTESITPNSAVSMSVEDARGKKITLTRADEIVTFVSRNLEPYRGYHTFMRSLPYILNSRPNARILLVGGDGVSYGAPPATGEKWKDIYIQEVRHQISEADWLRVHFLGQLPYHQFISLLQLSTVHVYLTYPFVLSWSLLEAMSAGCTIVASDTQPLREAILQDQTGRLVNFFDPKGLAREVSTLLDDAPLRARLGSAAREFAREHYDLRQICLPRQLEWVEGLAP